MQSLLPLPIRPVPLGRSETLDTDEPLLVASGGAAAAPADPLNAVAEGAVYAQTRCYRLIHHDTFAYEGCLDGMLADLRKPGPRRLGIEYFGFVGALNSSRLGMLGSENTAWNFLRRFRSTQKKLGFDDATLCAAIPGDCEVRIARIAAGANENSGEDMGVVVRNIGQVNRCYEQGLNLSPTAAGRVTVRFVIAVAQGQLEQAGTEAAVQDQRVAALPVAPGSQGLGQPGQVLLVAHHAVPPGATVRARTVASTSARTAARLWPASMRTKRSGAAAARAA